MTNDNERIFVVEIDNSYFIARYEGVCDYLEIKALVSHAAREIGNFVANDSDYAKALNSKLNIMGIRVEPAHGMIAVNF